MSSVAENTFYSFRENRTGGEAGVCRFRYFSRADALVFCFSVRDDQIVSPYERDNDEIYMGDAAEVFLSPDGDLTRYKELEVSPFGVRFYGNIRSDGIGAFTLEKIPPAFSAETRLEEGGWSAEITLPFSALGNYDREKMKFNAFCLDKRAGGEQRLYALNPTLCGSFHRPRFFL